MVTFKSIAILLLSVIILAVSCSKDDTNNNDGHETWVLYLPDELTTDAPVDLNFDGVANTDLSKEYPVDSASILVQKTDVYPVLNINWPEPLFDNLLLKPLPDTVGNAIQMRYLPVAQNFYYHFEQGNKTIVPDTRLVNDNSVYTFVFPLFLSLDGDFLRFSTKQDVFTSRKTHGQIVINAVFKKDRVIIN
jgi:hypothetical protein